MKNKYEIRGDITVIFIRRRDGSTVETVISTRDLQIAESIDGTWTVNFDLRARSFYVKFSRRNMVALRLHRILLNAPSGLEVDHINHDSLDNRRENLRLATRSENRQNLKHALRNNKSSGIRGISWHKHDKTWVVAITTQGKQKHIGRFKELEDAKKAIYQARVKYQPFSREAMEAENA